MNLPGSGPDVAKVKAEIEKMYTNLSRLDHFQLLGVAQDTPPEALTNAYRQLAKKWHRDAYGSMPLGDAQSKLDEIFSQISKAYETLSQADKRSEYLIFLKRKSQGLVTDVNAVFKAEELYDNALTAIRKKQFAEAKAFLEQAIALNKDEPLYHSSLGWVLFKADPKLNFRVAVETLKKATEMRENLAEAYYYLGEIYISRDDNDEALKQFKRCLRFDAKHIEASRRVRMMNQRAEQKKSGGALSGILDKIFKKK